LFSRKEEEIKEYKKNHKRGEIPAPPPPGFPTLFSH
jgi:hypothetical protein